jgi:hypothetical protein
MTKYDLLRTLARITHSNINIKGGNIFQHEIYLEILASNKHQSVNHEFKIPLRMPSKRRKHHHVDILTVDEHSVRAINSKGKSFNNTKSEDSELDEYNWYVNAIKKQYPDKKVTYIIFKDEYKRNDSKMSVYHYLNDNGILVYNTEEYMIENYGIDFNALEQRRQETCVKLCEKFLEEGGFDVEKIYASNC